MVKVKAIMSFNDLLEKKERQIGDTFECTEERLEVLLAHNAVEVIDNKKEEVVEEVIEEAVVEEPVVEIAEGEITYDVEPDAELKAEIKLEEKPKKKKGKK